jgi:hypothetical protein
MLVAMTCIGCVRVTHRDKTVGVARARGEALDIDPMFAFLRTLMGMDKPGFTSAIGQRVGPGASQTVSVLFEISNEVPSSTEGG